MHDSRADRIAGEDSSFILELIFDIRLHLDRLPYPKVVEHSVDYRPTPMPNSRMSRHPCRLVDNQERVVLVEDLQR